MKIKYRQLDRFTKSKIDKIMEGYEVTPQSCWKTTYDVVKTCNENGMNLMMVEGIGGRSKKHLGYHWWISDGHGKYYDYHWKYLTGKEGKYLEPENWYTIDDFEDFSDGCSRYGSGIGIVTRVRINDVVEDGIDRYYFCGEEFFTCDQDEDVIYFCEPINEMIKLFKDNNYQVEFKDRHYDDDYGEMLEHEINLTRN